MPIKVGKTWVTSSAVGTPSQNILPSNPVVQKTEPVEPQSKLNIVVEPTTEEQKTLKRNFVIERNKLKGVASGDTSLVVNGKKKSIGRKSHYLLDMLTLDSE